MPRFFIAAALLVAILAGCRPDPYQLVEVKGHVTTCEGKPAAGGTVVFYPVDDPDTTGRKKGNPGREARGTVAQDGSFFLTTIGIRPERGAVAGKHQVAFEMPSGKRRSISAEDRSNLSAEEVKKLEAEFASDPVFAPISCSNKIQPEEVTVQAGGSDFEFKLPPK
jgi:hypothetical protein